MPATGSQSAAPPASRRALFIVPPTGRFIREDRCQTPIDEMKTIALRPPIDLMYAAAAAEQAGCQCRLVDYPGELLGWSELDNCLREFRPHMLVLSITTPSLYKDVEAARLAKQVDPSILTVAKGAHFNALDMEAMRLYPMLDCVTRGEYEQTCAELATGKALEHIHGITWRSPGGEIVRNPGRPYIEDLDSLRSRHGT